MSARRSTFGRRPAGAVALFTLVALVSAACAGNPGGTSIGELRTVAKRVVGGGAECPLAIDVAAALRPHGFTGVVQPDQTNRAHASDAVIGADSPDSPLAEVQGVRVTCRFLAGPQRVTLVVVGVEKGHALSSLLGEVALFGGATKVDAAAFVNLMVDRRAGEARAVPGPGLAAAAPVATSDSSSQAVLVGVTPLPTTPAPGGSDAGVPAGGPGAEVLSAAQVTAFTAAIADDLAH